jgi:IPT/TIG domain
MVYIYGTNFTNISNPNEFNCRFAPINLPIPPKKMPGIFINSTTIMCASPGGWGQGDAVKLQVTFNGGDYDDNNNIFTFFSVTRAFPRSGPSDGSAGELIVEGFGFRNDTEPLCKFNNSVFPPSSVTWKQIRCPIPVPAGGLSYFGNVPLAVAANGKDWNNFVGGF